VRHSRKYLAALAAVLALAVGCGGTLMLLSHETPSATNVMTAGVVMGELHEVVAADAVTDPDLDTVSVSDGKDVKLDVKDGTVDLGYIQPGEKVVKKPYVKNLGQDNNVSAYVAIELVFSMKSDLDARHTDQLSQMKDDFFGSIADSLNGANTYPGAGPWRSTKSCEWEEVGADANAEYHKLYFYAKGSGRPDADNPDPALNGLIPLAADAETPYLFEKITIPDWEDIINPATNKPVSGVKYDLKIKAYMIQSDWVDTSKWANQNNNEKDWRKFFKDQFGTQLASLQY
jgi:hypothetical protein